MTSPTRIEPAERRIQMALRSNRSGVARSALALVLCAGMLTGCASMRPSVGSPGASNKGGILYRFFNPSYARNWSWWQKALFWVGPGH